MGIEESPWIEPVLEPVLSFEVGYQHFNRYHSGSKSCRYPGRDLFLEGGVFFATSPDLSFQLEMRLTQTHSHGWAIDQFKQMAQFIFLDDARGDPLALSVGIELIEPIPVGLRDISFIHHAPFEIEMHTAMGKEWSLEGERMGRIYGLAALGFGTRGTPWIRGFMGSEYRFCLSHVIGGRLSFGGGFGNEKLCKHHFRGYGDIAYRIIDATLEYTYQSECGDISFKYLRSLLRQNTPYAVQQFSLHIDHPFNL